MLQTGNKPVVKSYSIPCFFFFSVTNVDFFHKSALRDGLKVLFFLNGMVLDYNT